MDESQDVKSLMVKSATTLEFPRAGFEDPWTDVALASMQGSGFVGLQGKQRSSHCFFLLWAGDFVCQAKPRGVDMTEGKRYQGSQRP